MTYYCCTFLDPLTLYALDTTRIYKKLDVYKIIYLIILSALL